MPAISVIIPVYNSESSIATCIQSLLNQSFSDFEAICIDDASTDNSVATLQESVGADKRFIILKQEQNAGPSAARNRGIERARGSFLMFLDSDDEYEPHTLKRLYTLATEQDLDLIDFCARTIYESREVKSVPQESLDNRSPIDGPLPGPELFCEYMRKGEYRVALCLHFFRKSLLEASGLRLEEGIIHEDDLFVPLLHAQACRALFLNECLYIRHFHEGSLVTKPRGIFNVGCLFKVTEKLQDWLYAHAHEYSTTFIDYFARYIWSRRKILADDILRCTAEEIALFQEGLTPEELARFNTNAVQMAADAHELRISKTWKLANAIAKVPRMATRLARK